MKINLRDILLALCVPLVWGMGFVVAKAGLGEFPPLFLMGLRFAVSALILLWFFPPPPGKLRTVFMLALVSATLQYGLTYGGLRGLTASTTVLLLQLEVPFGALLAAILLKDRLGWTRTIGLVFAFAGVAMVAGNPTMPNERYYVALVIGGAFTWALGQVLIKKYATVSGFHLLAWISIFAAPQMIVASFLLETGQWEAVKSATIVGWGAILYLGIVMTTIGYGIWYHILKKYDVNQVMPLLLLVPVVSIVGAAVFLGERPTVLTLLGGLIVIGGVAAIIWAGQRMAGTAAEVDTHND